MITEWITINKVFFEVISPILFGTAAVLISLAAYYVSKNQLILSRHQYRLAHTEIEPHFVFKENDSFDEDGKPYERHLIITNIGAPVYNLNITTMTFLKAIFFDGIKDRLFALNGYYCVTYSSNTHVGTLATKTGPDNRRKFRNFYFELINTKNKKYNLNLCDVITVSQISFKNQIGDEHEIHFYNTSIAPKEMVTDLLDNWFKYPMLELEDLTLEKVYDLLSIELGN